MLCVLTEKQSTVNSRSRTHSEQTFSTRQWVSVYTSTALLPLRSHICDVICIHTLNAHTTKLHHISECWLLTRLTLFLFLFLFLFRSIKYTKYEKYYIVLAGSFCCVVQIIIACVRFGRSACSLLLLLLLFRFLWATRIQRFHVFHSLFQLFFIFIFIIVLLFFPYSFSSGIFFIHFSLSCLIHLCCVLCFIVPCVFSIVFFSAFQTNTPLWKKKKEL